MELPLPGFTAAQTLWNLPKENPEIFKHSPPKIKLHMFCPDSVHCQFFSSQYYFFKCLLYTGTSQINQPRTQNTAHVSHSDFLRQGEDRHPFTLTYLKQPQNKVPVSTDCSPHHWASSDYWGSECLSGWSLTEKLRWGPRPDFLLGIHSLFPFPFPKGRTQTVLEGRAPTVPITKATCKAPFVLCSSKDKPAIKHTQRKVTAISACALISGNDVPV